MGYMVHHAIIVTGRMSEPWMGAGRVTIEAAHAKALELCASTAASVTEILPKAVNGYASFLIGPDGSKAGWSDSTDGDVMRAAMVQWLQAVGEFDWAEVQYGDDDGDNKLLAPRQPDDR